MFHNTFRYGFLKIWNNGLFKERHQDNLKFIFKSMKNGLEIFKTFEIMKFSRTRKIIFEIFIIFFRKYEMYCKFSKRNMTLTEQDPPQKGLPSTRNCFKYLLVPIRCRLSAMRGFSFIFMAQLCPALLMST